MNDVHQSITTALAYRYTVEREIGRGGTSCVFLAQDLKHSRQVALKVLRPELAASVGAERFLREIQIEASLQHPNILPLYDSGEADRLLYFTMPYVAGETLRDRLRRETQLDFHSALSITADVVEALAYAHSHNVVHRDIKPENILLSNGHAFVADFGVARAVSEAGGKDLTDSGIAVGTPMYMSPEQALGSSNIDFRSDVYSLALVVYEMLAGEPPFTGATPLAVLARQASERVPSLEIVRPNVPSGIVMVIEKALEKVPADRYQSVEAFGHALNEGSTTEVQRMRPHVRRRRRTLAPLAAGIFAVLGVVVWWAFGTRARPNSDWVMVYPLDVSGDAGPAGASLGEDNAYLIWNALDGRGSITWINAMDRVEDPAELTRMSASARAAFARDQGAWFYLFGRTWREDDSAFTYLTLHDAVGDSVVARADTSGSRGEARLLGVRIVGELLLRFLPEETVDVSAIAGRNAEAVQEFIQAERHFHAGRFLRAFDSYGKAVHLDSSFALAAVKGAQAASWLHDVGTAGDLINLALEHAQALTPKHLHFAQGLEDFLAAKADSAVIHFERALAIEGEWTEAWTGLGEVYMHLLPRNSPQDSLARDAMRRVYENTAGSAPALYHLVEFAVRDGDLGHAADLLAQYRSTSPDTSGYALPKLELMLRCAERGPAAIDWRAEVLGGVAHVAQAARSLSVGGALAECALAGWHAVRQFAAPNDVWQYTAWAGLQSLLVATERTEELVALLDTTSMFRTFTELFYIIDALAGVDVNDRADSVARALRNGVFDRFDYENWFLGIWDVYHGRIDEARAIRDTLAARAEATGGRRTTLVAGSLDAHVVLAEGDTTRAISLFEALTPTADRASLQHPWEALCLERMIFSRVLLARRHYTEAYRLASTSDSPGAANVINTLFLPTSLLVRAEAAEAMGDRQLADEARQRLAALRRR